MARLARIVIPGVAHHVTQRGNRRVPIFFSDEDRQSYLAEIASAAERSGTSCLAWCLMDNHVHLVLVPSSEDGLRATLGEAHRRYTRRINFREGWRGASRARSRKRANSRGVVYTVPESMMFSITTTPPLPPSKAPYEDSQCNLSEAHIARMMENNSEEYRLEYNFGNSKFSYYPSSLMTVLNDLCLELDLMRSRENHRLTIAGYPILDVVIEGDRALFRDPSGDHIDDQDEWADVQYDEVVAKLKCCIAQVLEHSR